MQMCEATQMRSEELGKLSRRLQTTNERAFFLYSPLFTPEEGSIIALAMTRKKRAFA